MLPLWVAVCIRSVLSANKNCTVMCLINILMYSPLDHYHCTNASKVYLSKNADKKQFRSIILLHAGGFLCDSVEPRRSVAKFRRNPPNPSASQIMAQPLTVILIFSHAIITDMSCYKMK